MLYFLFKLFLFTTWRYHKIIQPWCIKILKRWNFLFVGVKKSKIYFRLKLIMPIKEMPYYVLNIMSFIKIYLIFIIGSTFYSKSQKIIIAIQFFKIKFLIIHTCLVFKVIEFISSINVKKIYIRMNNHSKRLL